MNSLSILTLVSVLQLAMPGVAQGDSGGARAPAERQTGPRPVFGRILDNKGKPVIGAEVHMISNLVAGLPELGDNDVISVVSDERGRFRARLLPGRDYSAWAWQTRADGSRWGSPIQERVRPGPALDLRLTLRQGRATLKLVTGPGGERFGKGRYALGGRNFILKALDEITTGTWEVPRLAGTSASLRLYDPKGKPIQRYTLNSTRPLMTVTPRPLKRVTIRALAGSEPIEGVRILRTDNGWNETIATTDKDGLARVVVEGYVNKRTGRFRSSRELLLLRPGYAATVARVEGKPSEKGDLPTLDVQLQAGRRVRGRWLDAEGHPLDSVPLALFTNHDRWSPGRLSQSSQRHPLVFHTDAEGRFDLAGLGRRFAWRLVAFPPDAASPVLLASSSKPPTEDLDLGDLHTRDFVRLDLAIVSAEGRPVREGRLVLGEAGSAARDRLAVYAPLWLFPDRRGRARVLCRPGLRPAFAAAWQGAFVEHAIQAALPARGPIPIELRLPRMIHLSGQVLHEDIGSFADTQVRVYCRNMPTGRLKITNLLRSIASRSVRPDGRFEVQLQPGSVAMLQVTYRHTGKEGPKYYSGTLPYKTYEEDQADLRIELKERANVKRGAVQIGLGVRRQAGGK